MKLFGINLSSDAQLHRDIDPNYSRFAPEKTRMAARPINRVPRQAYVAGDADLPNQIKVTPAEARQTDELFSEDNLDVSTLRNALPKRFEALHEEIARDARDAARELAAAAN